MFLEFDTSSALFGTDSLLRMFEIRALLLSRRRDRFETVRPVINLTSRDCVAMLAISAMVQDWTDRPIDRKLKNVGKYSNL
jgi:hypothetical protein